MGDIVTMYHSVKAVSSDNTKLATTFVGNQHGGDEDHDDIVLTTLSQCVALVEYEEKFYFK